MKKDFSGTLSVIALSLGLFSACGIDRYPGQPHVRTTDFSKIDYEVIDEEGLWVYETSYDNRKNAAGVSAIISKLYPFRTHGTSNSEANAHGSVYLQKFDYSGATVQALAMPNIGQIYMPRDSMILGFMSFDVSMNEVDVDNSAERSSWGSDDADKVSILSTAGKMMKQFRWDVLRAGKLNASGDLEYVVSAIEMGGKRFHPSVPVQVTTNIIQNQVKTNLTRDMKKEFVSFFEQNFAKGYKGEIKVFLDGKDSSEAIGVDLSIETPKSLQNKGNKVMMDVDQASIDAMVADLAKRAE